jgi:hypothetical protein
MVVENIIAELQKDTLSQTLQTNLSQWPGVEQADVERVIRWVSALRDDLIALVKEVGDPEEITMTLAINYIELKSRWIALNTKMNYQNFRTGSCDTLTALRGSGISALLARLEELLTPQDIEQIADFLAQPVKRAA